jgi:hypothetical protein
VGAKVLLFLNPQRKNRKKTNPKHQSLSKLEFGISFLFFEFGIWNLEFEI